MSSEVAASIEKSQRALAIALRALDTTRTSKSSASSSSSVPTPPPALADIMAALLQQLRSTITMLALAMKPPLTASAVAPQLTKIEDQIGRLVSCVLAAAGGDPSSTSQATGSSTLVEVWRDAVDHIGSQVDRLLTTLRDDARSGVAETKVAKDEAQGQPPYLAHTGLVWAAIDGFAVPRSEVEAVASRWDGQKATVRDAWSEFKEMLEDEGDDSDEDDEMGGIEDEWAELENVGGKMSSSERSRAEAAKSLFGLHQILHATVPRYLSLLSLAPEESYGTLLEAGDNFVAALDTAVSAMYPKQDVAEINGAVDDVNDKGRALAAGFRERLGRASQGQEGSEREVAKSFVQRWESKLADESKAWQEKRMSVGGLAEALE